MLCLADLAELIEGRLHFGPMPPVAGAWTRIGRIALDSRLVERGDLFWRLPGLPWQTACCTQHALFREAAGVVVAAADVAAWSGSFCLEVDNPIAALARVVDWLDGPRSECRGSASAGPFDLAEQKCLELKDLQLCRYKGLDITPPTCGRPSSERVRSCGRRAA